MVIFFYFKGWSLDEALRGRGAGERKKRCGGWKEIIGEDETEICDRGMDAQVLLLMDPGAELDWAVLSDTLPSAGEKAALLFTGQISNTLQSVHFLSSLS